MKLATYNPVVNKNSINGVQVRAYDDGSAAYMRQSAAQTETAGRIAASIGQMQGQTLKGIANTIQNVGEQIDAVNVQAASNEYTKRLNNLLYNQDNGLMNTQMQGADGITQKFEEEERKIRQEVGSQFKFLSPKGAMTFNRMTDNSATQRFELVRRHQTQQYNAYKDVTYNNALELNTQTAADNYAMPEVVDQNMAEAIASVRMRYADQGEEVVKAQERKAVGGIAQQVINRAYAQGDLDSAETYIEKYGRYMNPQTLTGYAKNVYASRMSTMQEVTAKSLLSQFGDNMEAAYNYINSAEFGGNGNADSSVAWFKDMSDKGEGWGVNTCTKGVNAALMAGGYKPINTWAPTAWDEEKAAGRTFTDRSKLRNGDIVYWDSAGDNDASHVGIYDAKTGMVYQSGTSGFRPISLDAYKLIGFSHPRGKAATPEDRKKLFAAYQHEVALHKQFEAQAEKRALESTDNEFFQMFKNGETDPEVYRMAAAQKAGDDPKMYRKLVSLGNSYARVAAGASGASGSGSGGKSDPLLEYKLANMLKNGASRSAILEFMDDRENNFTGQDKKKALEVLDKYDQGKGQFAYDWDGMKDEIMAEYKQKDKSYAWGNVQQKLIYDINAYRAQHGGQDPDRATVAQWGREALVEGISYSVPGKLFGTNTVKTNLATAAAHGIMDVAENPSGGKNITLKDGRTINVTDAQYARIIEQNMSVEQAINAG